MKLLFDQNLAYRMVAKISEVFPDSAHVAALNLDKATDLEIWEFAKTNGYVIVTKDSDFNDLTAYHGFPPHIIWLRSGNSSVDTNAELLLRHADQIQTMILSQETGIVEVVG